MRVLHRVSQSLEDATSNSTGWWYENQDIQNEIFQAVLQEIYWQGLLRDFQAQLHMGHLISIHIDNQTLAAKSIQTW